MHALLEGEQIVDVRKGGLHEDGRHFDVATRRCWLSPDRRAPTGRAAQARLRALGRSRRRLARRRSRSRVQGWADIVDVATITEPEHLDALDSKLIWARDYVESRFTWKRRDPLWVLVLRVHRLDDSAHRCRGTTTYGGCTSWVDYDGLPDDPATLPSEPVLSDVAFEAKHKGIREALPAGVLPDALAEPSALARAGVGANDRCGR